MKYNLIFPKKASSYCEISQGSNTKFSGIIREGNNLYECFTPAKCRDYLADSFSYKYTAFRLEYDDSIFYDMEQYGFSIANSSDPLWEVSKDGYVYMKVQSHVPEELNSIIKYLHLLNTYFKRSKFLGKPIKVLTKGKVVREEVLESSHKCWSYYTNNAYINGDYVGEVGYIILKIHRNWFSSIPSISLVSLMIRTLAWGWLLEKTDAYASCETMEQFFEGIINNKCSRETKYVEELLEIKDGYCYSFDILLENWDKIVTTMTNMMSIEFPRSIPNSDYDSEKYCDLLHNFGGIISTIKACRNCMGLRQASLNIHYMDSNLALISVMYYKLVMKILKEGPKNKYYTLLSSAVTKTTKGEIKWEMLKKADFWPMARARYADLPTL